MKIKLTAVLMMFLVLTSCNKLNKKYSNANAPNDLVDIGKSISEDDYDILTDYILADIFSGGNLEGISYKDILTQAKLKIEEDEKLAKEELVNRLKRIKTLSEAVTVSVYKKGFYEGDFDSQITLSFRIENKSYKPIKAFKGDVEFKNAFGEIIKTVSITYDKELSGKLTVGWEAGVDYNSFDSDDALFKSKTLNQLTINWIPEEVLFKDGTGLK